MTPELPIDPEPAPRTVEDLLHRSRRLRAEADRLEAEAAKLRLAVCADQDKGAKKGPPAAR